jgi:catechol 2,3-dioxygenase-like lactoylglutathione lyase family enzyme
VDSPFAVDSLDHIVLRVRDLEKSIAFYDMFGGKPEASSGAINTPMALGPATRVLLHHEPGYVPQADGVNLQHFALFLSTDRDVSELVEYFRAHGAEPFDGPKDNGRGWVQFRVNDPDGNEIELRISQSAKSR